jgi:hypothetical protein
MAKRKCTKIFLQGMTNGGDHKFLNIAPTMKKITHEGRTYFRTDSAWAQDPTDGEWAVTYLWDGWMAWRMNQMETEQAGTP